MLVIPTKKATRGSAQNRASIAVFFGLAAMTLSAHAGTVESVEAAASAWSLRGDVKPMLQQFCLDCHNPEKRKGDLDLTSYLENDKLHENRTLWEKVAKVVEAREMPPGKKPQPSEDQRELLVRFIDGQLAKFDCKLTPNPGKVTLRRLNRDEYRNTIRDLLGVDFNADEFPNDEVGYGFDNIADVLSLSPMLMEKFVNAAEEVAQSAIVTNVAPKSVVKRLQGDRFTSAKPWVKPLETRALGLYREGEAAAEFHFPVAGEYLFRVMAFGDQAGPEAPKLAFRINGHNVRVFDVTAAGQSAGYEARASLPAGKQKIAVAFVNDYWDEVNADERLRGDRNLFLESMEITFPQPAAPPLPGSHTRLIPAMPAAGQEMSFARESLSAFGDRAYRRPATEGEVARLANFVGLALQNGGTFLEGMQVAVQAALCSPHFLFRWELDPPGATAEDTRALTDFEVASRLSYFLWSSMPDDQLFRLAKNGELRQDGNLEKQALRMMEDGRARQFVSNFAGQWLQIRNLSEVSIDPDHFPGWDDALKFHMKEETELFFDAVMKDDRPVTDLLEADFTFLSEKLARHYGVDGVKGEEFQRVTLPKKSERGGVLTQGSVLLATSTPTRTSPVIRGKWILEQILGTPPPPPPPDVPPLPEEESANQSAPLRVRLEQHRSKAECAGCHSRMDPLGFALENFDAVGRWRTMDGKFPIDPSGRLESGETFSGPAELKKILKNTRFIHSLSEKMMVYALGRGLEYFDKCAVDAVVARMAQNENRFSSLITGIVTSEPFLRRKTGAGLAAN